MKIKQLAEDIKAMGAKNGWAIITATQTNRSAFDADDITASQVSESSGLGATVDIMFAIIADPLMKAQGKYYLKCIYDRVSPQENKKKLFDCNFNYLRLVENSDEGIIDMSSMIYGTSQSSQNNNGTFRRSDAPQQYTSQQFSQGVPDKPQNEFVTTEFDITLPSNNTIINNAQNAKDITTSDFMYKGKGLF
jgi:hypothetical protein